MPAVITCAKYSAITCPASCPAFSTAPHLLHPACSYYLRFSMSMPGSFPTAVSPSLPRDGALNADFTLLEPDFVAKQAFCSKVAAQKSLLVTLSSTTTFLVGYQFLRYTHGACLPPTLAHLLIQVLLQPWRAYTASELELYEEHLDLQEQYFILQMLPFNRTAAARTLLKKTCLLIYWKFVAVVAYHVFFVVFWLRAVALDGRLKNLEHGSWFGVSFIGECIYIEILRHDLLVVQLWKLELVPVLLLDLAILVLQLTMYQCIFVQSTLSPRGMRLNEPDAFILRGTPSVPLEKPLEPPAICVRLYESLQKDAYALVASPEGAGRSNG